MLNPLHPGVYIQEVPGVPTVQAAATSIPVFIGLTEKVTIPGDVNTPRLITSWASYLQYFGGLVWGAYLPWAVREFFAEGGAYCNVISINPASGTTGTTSDIANWTVSAASQGAWANYLYVSILDANPPAIGKDPSNFFNVAVVVSQANIETDVKSGTLVAQLIYAYVKANSIAPVSIPKASGAYYVLEMFGPFTASSLLRPTSAPCLLATQINAKSMFVRITNTPTAITDLTKLKPALVAPTKGNLKVTSKDSLQDYSAAANLLNSIQGASLVATPDAVFDSNFKDNVKLILSACEPSFFYVIDPPFYADSSHIQDLVAFKDGTDASKVSLESPFGALYAPWIFTLYSATGANVPVPPSGAVLGRYAYTDYNVGVFKSPAGVRDGSLGTATGVSFGISDADQDVLNPNGINAIRSIPSYGITIYGARTLQVGGGEWQYIAVRRFVMFVEQSLRMNLQWVVFEPSSEGLWAIVVREISSFLTILWEQGALFGSTPEEAFFVTCDTTNNPPDSRATGVLNVDVGLAVVFPAEFVVIRIAQMSGAPSTGS